MTLMLGSTTSKIDSAVSVPLLESLLAEIDFLKNSTSHGKCLQTNSSRLELGLAPATITGKEITLDIQDGSCGNAFAPVMNSSEDKDAESQGKHLQAKSKTKAQATQATLAGLGGPTRDAPDDHEKMTNNGTSKGIHIQNKGMSTAPSSNSILWHKSKTSNKNTSVQKSTSQIQQQ